MSFQLAVNRLLPKAYSVPSLPTMTFESRPVSSCSVATIMIGIASTATSINRPWKKSVQHTALKPPRNV